MPRAYNAALRRQGLASPPSPTGSSKMLRKRKPRSGASGAIPPLPESSLPSRSIPPLRRQGTSNSDPLSGSGGPSGTNPLSGAASPPASGPSSAASGASGSSQGDTSPSSQSSQSQSQSSQSQSSQASQSTSDTTSQTSSTTSASTSTTTTTTSSTTASSASASNSASSASSSSTSAPSSTSSQSSGPSSSSASTPTPTPTSSNTPNNDAVSGSSSGGIFTTIYSTVTTDINGQPTTFTTAIPTTLPYPSSSGSGSSNRAIITGSAIGGTVFVIIVVALVIFLQRSDRIRMNYKKLRVFGKGRRSMLEDEDEDDWLGAPGIGTTTQYRDYPASVASSAQQPFVMHNRGASAASRLPSNPTTPMQEFQAPPPQPTSPYLMGMRAASSGSIFHEAVWPPPSEDSRFVDPLVAGSSQVDLGRIVPDVMGPNQQTRSVAYGTPVVVGAAAVPIHGRTPSAAGLLSYASGPASPTATTVTHQTSQTAYTTQTTPSHGPKPSHSLKRSWDRAKNQPVDESLYALDAAAEPASDDFDRAGTGSPVPLEPQGTRLFIRNAEPLSPSSPPTELEGFPQHARRDSTNGSPGGSPRWLDRQVKKD